MYAIHRQAAPPSGVAHSLSARLTPSCLQGSSRSRSKIIRNLVTATNDCLQLFEIVEEIVQESNGNADLLTNGASNGHRKSPDEQEQVKEAEQEEEQSLTPGQGKEPDRTGHPSTRARLQFVREYKLHGIVTGLHRIRTVDTARDGLERLLVSFKHAKASLLEWSAEAYDLVTVSLHTFEKLPQLIQGDLTGYRSMLRVDPAGRCSGLLLPQDSLAITPFFQDQIELEGADENVTSLPYAPSSVIALGEISPQLRHIIDFVFLTGFNEPTLAILAQPNQTWTSRLENARDVTQLFLVTIDVTATPPSSTIISQTSNLPYDCFGLTACPRDLGGVIISTPNALIHVDQAGKLTGASFNPWANIVSEATKFEQATEEALGLEHSHLMFISAEIAVLILQDGTTRAVRVQRDGRTIAKITAFPDVFDKTTMPSSLELVRSHLAPEANEEGRHICYAFVGSMLGDSQLWRIDFRTIVEIGKLDDPVDLLQAKAEAEILDDEEDIDLYGSAEAKEAALTDVRDAKLAAATRYTVTSALTFSLPGYGPVRAATIGTIHEGSQPELVACAGDPTSGGLTVIHRSLAPHLNSKIALDHSTEYVWGATTRGKDGWQNQWLFTSSEGETQAYRLKERLEEEPEYVKTFAKTTLSVATLANSTQLVCLHRDAILVLDNDLKQISKTSIDKDSQASQLTVADDVILIQCDNGPPLLYKATEGVLNPLNWLDETPLKASMCWNSRSTFQARDRKQVQARRQATYRQAAGTNGINGATSDAMDEDLYGNEAATAAPLPKEEAKEEENGEQGEATTGENWPWLCTYSASGQTRIYLLPQFEEVFTSGDLLTQPCVFEDKQSGVSYEELPEDVKLEQMYMAYIGTRLPLPHMLLLLEDGTLVIYEATEDFGVSSFKDGSNATLSVRWVKRSTHALGMAKQVRAGGTDAVPSPANRLFVPFGDVGGYSGVFITGSNPYWLVKEDFGPARLFECGLSPVYGFTSIGSSHVISLGEDIVIATLPENTHLHREQPFTKVVQNRTYTGLVFMDEMQCYAALSTFEAPFEIFDEEGKPIHPHDSEQALEPTGSRSALEVIEPGSWKTVDGHEFRQYETALSIARCTLETKSTSSGQRDFVAVGTIISRGEDLASKGALYVFEIMAVEPLRSSSAPRRKLRLLFREDLKAPVGNVESLNNYVLHSVGLKIYAKAFEEDERLLSVGFLDVGVHTSCTRTLKNLVLLGDAVKGLHFIAFQEEPFKFVTLGKDVHDIPVVTVDFLVSEGKALLVSSDMHGVIRLYEFDPLRAETQGGQRLLPRVEFQQGAEAAYSVPFARSTGGEPKQSGILFLNMDGSLSTIVPVRDAVYKRLQLLERQMVRHTHHFAGLNPRAYRVVRNDFVPRPLTKGLLDGDLLASYSALSLIKQQQLADPLGSDSDTINYNIRSLKAPW